MKEGIVPGGGIALLNATNKVKLNKYEKILVTPLMAPFQTILANAGIVGAPIEVFTSEAVGIDVITGKTIDMVKKGIVDPVLVTKSALKNAVSVVTTIISADCVISNMRGDESDK